jgi:hypothetical protein
MFLNVGATVSERCESVDDLVWEGPWVKPIDRETLLGKFAGWDERAVNIIKVMLDFFRACGHAERKSPVDRNA